MLALLRSTEFGHLSSASGGRCVAQAVVAAPAAFHSSFSLICRARRCFWSLLQVQAKLVTSCAIEAWSNKYISD